MPQRRARSKSVRNTVIIAIYGAVFFALLLLAVMNRTPAAEPVYGSMDGRFDSKITLEQDGKTYHYREAEITNYLLIGLDRGESGSGYRNSVQADFLLLLSVDRRNQKITPLMVERDTIATVTTYGVFGNQSGEKQMQICLAQAFHSSEATGSSNTVSVLSRMLGGVPIDHYAAVDLDGISRLNDAVGGVEVVLEDDFTALDPEMAQGAAVLLKGEQAEWFVRSRMDVADGTNASRMKRQQQYLESLLSKLSVRKGREQMLEDALGALEGYCETDMTDEAIWDALQRYDSYEWQPFAYLLGAYRAGADGFTEFWLDEDRTREMLAELWFR